MSMLKSAILFKFPTVKIIDAISLLGMYKYYPLSIPKQLI